MNDEISCRIAAADPALAATPRECGSTAADLWTSWQREVVALLRRALHEIVQDVSLEDVDWPAWRDYYLKGKSPRAAVDRALERDL